MKLAESTWQDVEKFERSCVVVVPTGSLEQHGPHLPLLTDSILVTMVAEQIEAALPGKVLLSPTLWLGASGHHLAFAGSMSHSFEGYIDSVLQCVGSLRRHGFYKFMVLNGHGGNTELNGIAVRKAKESDRELVIGHTDYFGWISQGTLDEVLDGPVKGIRHACEAEASMMLHVRPELVRVDRLRDDGLVTDPPVPGLCWMFDEVTDEGSMGFAKLASAEKGARLIGESVAGGIRDIGRLADGVSLKSMLPE